MNLGIYKWSNTNRWLSPDTIVPDPGNPQSFNRYSYTRNNPVNRIDPSGHVDCALLGDSGDTQGCGTPLPSLVKFTAADERSWTAEEKAVIQSGAWQVASVLFKAGGGQFASMQEAFLAVFGGQVTFHKTGTTSDKEAMGEAVRKGFINVYDHDTALTGETTGSMWAAHELGHAFNIATKQEGEFWGQGYIDLAQEGVWVGKDRIAGNIYPQSYSDDDYYIRTADGYRPGLYSRNGGPYQQNNISAAGEDFADMFMNWSFNSFAHDDYGTARYSFMDDHMSTWISLAVSNNQ